MNFCFENWGNGLLGRQVDGLQLAAGSEEVVVEVTNDGLDLTLRVGYSTRGSLQLAELCLRDGGPLECLVKTSALPDCVDGDSQVSATDILFQRDSGGLAYSGIIASVDGGDQPFSASLQRKSRRVLSERSLGAVCGDEAISAAVVMTSTAVR